MIAPASAPAESAVAETPTVLVVEDSPIDRSRVRAIVQKQLGWNAVFAPDGVDALEQFERSPPDIVLTDLQLPGLDGLGVVEAVRERRPDVPVVIMTAHGSELVAMQALRAGAASYVPKKALALDLAETLERVHAMAQVSRRRRRLAACARRAEVVYELDNDPALIPDLIASLQEMSGGLGVCSGNNATRVGVALEEALLNGIYHGNLEVSSDLRQGGDERPFREAIERNRRLSPYRERRLRVEVRATADEFEAVVRDQGPGFNTASLPDPTDPENLLRVGGRGILLMRTFMDEVRFNEKGNEVTLIKRR